MNKKYVATRISKETHEALKVKQKKMMEMYKRLTGKTRNIPLTKVMNIIAKQPVYIEDVKLVKVVKKKKGRMLTI